MITTKRSGVAAVLAAAAVVLGASGPAVAAPAVRPAGGKVQIFVNLNVQSQTVQPTLWTGAIGDVGTSTSLNAKGKVDPNGNFEKEQLRHGTFMVDASPADAAVNKAGPVVNRATCSIYISGTGPATLSRGTGLYKGISGRLMITISYAAVFPRLANGKCNFSDKAKPVGAYGQVTGAGTVHFG